jgi:hypothetical protein
VNAPHVRLETAPGGHLGVLSGRKASSTTWRYLDEFLRDIDDEEAELDEEEWELDDEDVVDEDPDDLEEPGDGPVAEGTTSAASYSQ